ncbi:MAG: hypothetical protein NC417_14350 [Candidatus Gastranaerophilales bacterium]|nr:hypothetical protein [Candidatus Gastranaerophilales bacterium]
MQNDILQRIEESDMLLIGFGEAFDDLSFFHGDMRYQQMVQRLEAAGQEWLLPAYCDMLRGERKETILTAMQRFAAYIAHKNYFVITTSTGGTIRKVPWREGRLVTPCGSGGQKQCVHGCEEGLMKLTEEDRSALEAYFDVLEKGMQPPELRLTLGKCPKCGGDLILNNIYTQYYDEKGYLEDWKRYTGWLQGTLNHKLLILELGVGMQCPTVIRFPFEKIAFYNKKAYLCRVNETLYQLTEELKEKGCSISENPVDWLQFLC